MADKIIRDATLTSIADAIRAKAGTSGSMVFPQGFISTLDNISAEQASGYKVATGIISFPTAQTSFSLNFDFNVISGLIALLEGVGKSRPNSLTTRVQELLTDSGSTNTMGIYGTTASGNASSTPDFVLNGGNVSWSGTTMSQGARNVWGTYFYLFWGT